MPTDRSLLNKPVNEQTLHAYLVAFENNITNNLTSHIGTVNGAHGLPAVNGGTVVHSLQGDLKAARTSGGISPVGSWGAQFVVAAGTQGQRTFSVGFNGTPSIGCGGGVGEAATCNSTAVVCNISTSDFNVGAIGSHNHGSYSVVALGS